MKKVAIIGSTGVPAKYGGFETLAHQLVINLEDKSELSVYCSAKLFPEEERQTHFHGAELHYVPLNGNGWQSIVYDIYSILHALTYADVLLILGVPGAIILPFVKLFSRKKIIVHLDGLEWKRDKWNKAAQLFLKFSESIAARFSDEIIADNQALYEYVEQTYNKDARVIAYGGDHTFQDLMEVEAFEKLYPFTVCNYAFSVCRIEPENNTHLILEAFSEQETYELIFVGNWLHSDYSRKLYERYKHLDHIHLVLPIYDNTILDRFKEKAKLYIHGHSAGGTNPSLVEAMYAKMPVIAFDVNFNRYSTFGQAEYFSSKEELKEIVSSISESDMLKNAARMKKSADSKYKWSIIADNYLRMWVKADKTVAKKRNKTMLKEVQVNG